MGSSGFPEGYILDVARSAGLEPKPRGDEFVIRCPWADDHKNRDAHPSCRLNADKNVFHCDPCGRGGGAKDLAEALGVDHKNVPGGQPKVAWKKASSTKKSLIFASSGSVSTEVQQLFADVLGKRYESDTWTAFGVLEGRVHPKNRSEMAEDAIAFPLLEGGFHVYKFRQKNKKQRWKFANDGKAGLIAAGLERDGVVILAEGEWDAMRAHELGCAAVTATGAGTFRIEWSDLLKGRKVAVVYDVDAAGQAGSVKAIHALASVALTVWNVQLPLSGNLETDGKDLSDFVAVYGGDALKQLVLDSEKASSDSGGGLAGSEADKVVARAIDTVLCMEGPIRLKRREAARLVIEDLSKRGELVQATGGRQFWFNRMDRKLLELDSFKFRSSLIHRYEINPAEAEFRHIVEAVRAHTQNYGRSATVYRFCYYDRDSNRLYVSAGAGRVIRLDGQLLSWIEHGDDGVLFEGREDFDVVPNDATEIAPADDYLHRHILDRINFIRGTGVILSPDAQRLILHVWVLSIFFPELLPAKVLLLLYGEKGSGKTTTVRVILKLLLGPSANVMPLAKEDGFNAAISNDYLIGLDNVDSYCRWIEDRLATVATGQTIRLRKLYTTNEIVSFPTRCAIALTARTPRFRRDDVVDRLQILRVARLDKFSRETDWYAEIEAHRSELWAQLLRDLNAIVALLGKERSASPEKTRMADWGFLATTIGEVLGQEEAVRDALDAAELDKAQFLLEADELYDLLYAVANDSTVACWKAGELYAELNRCAERDDIEFRVKSPRSLGRILRRLEPALKMMIHFEIKTDTHDRQAIYVLEPLVEDGSNDFDDS